MASGAFRDLKPPSWCLTDDYLQYMQADEQKWIPDADYYIRLISRLVDSIFIASRYLGWLGGVTVRTLDL